MHMKIKRKLLLFTIILIVAVLIIARVTGIYQFYDLPTSSMEPSLQINQKILASNLKSPERNSVIIFTRSINEKFETDPNGKKNNFCYRLIAKGGDTLEIKKGYAYVNGQLTDDTTKLKFPYSLSTGNFSNLLTLLEIDVSSPRVGSDFFSIGEVSHAFLTYGEYEKANKMVPLTRIFEYSNTPAPAIYEGKNWSVDSFGPYVVPLNHFFVMGDNRHNAMDSRYIGPIPVKDCKGVMIAEF